MGKNNKDNEVCQTTYKTIDIAKFLIASTIGLFAFFVPLNINGNNTILLDHIVTGLRTIFPDIVTFYATVVVFIGAITPFITKKWYNSISDTIFSIFKVLGFIFAFLYYMKLGPSWLMAEETGGFLYDKLVVPLSLLIPIGSVFLVLIVGYGLLEFIGVLFQPIMKPLWKTPGRSAVDAVASFVGSYSIGLLITNRVYKEGKYTLKEATIIAMGFSTVSAPIVIVVAKTLDLMEMWNLFFWSALVTTFVVTIITVRIPPLRNKSNEYYDDKGNQEPDIKSHYIKNAWNQGMTAAHNSSSLWSIVKSNLVDGFKMTVNLLPLGMSIGLLGIILANNTPVFDVLGYIFAPITYLLQVPEPLLLAKATSLTIVEMILPSLIVTGASLMTKFVLGIVTTSAIIFFAGSIPSMLATDIPFKIWELIVVWFERVVFSLIIAALIAHLLL